MQRLRFLALALVLSVALVASFEATAVASGGTGAAKKKCKKGYKLKKGKCTKKKKSKKSTTPKLGFYIGQAAGNGEIRLRLYPRKFGGQYISVFKGSAKATCSDGSQKVFPLTSTATLHGKSFTPYYANNPLAGSFKTATTLKGTVRVQHAKDNVSGVTCDTGAVSFSAKWAGP